MQPCAERRVAAERGGLLPGANENVLREVIRVLRSRHPPGKRVDARHVHAIERFISQKVPRVKLEDFDYRYTALFEEGKPGQPTGGARRVTGVRLRGGYFFGPAKKRR